MRIFEIERMSQAKFTGGRSALEDERPPKRLTPLPGGSGMLYSVTKLHVSYIQITIWDPQNPQYVQPKKRPSERTDEYIARLEQWRANPTGPSHPRPIARLIVMPMPHSAIKNAVQIKTITVDEDYRNQGLAKALYGIVLTEMRRPIIADYAQTPGGRRNWVSLSQIPGVEVKGYVGVSDPEPTGFHNIPSDEEEQEFDQNIDTVMGQLGGDYIGAQGQVHYFAFDVEPTTTGQELQAHVKTELSRIYHGDAWNERSNMPVGLYATWTGQ